MTHSPGSTPPPTSRPQWLDLGLPVVTPSGRYGTVVALELTVEGLEATVEWARGDRATFRAAKLRPAG